MTVTSLARLLLKALAIGSGKSSRAGVLSHERWRLSNITGNVTLLFTLGQLAADVIGDFTRRELIAMKVLNDLVSLLVVVADESRDRGLVGELRRTVAA